jgi:hypothetical protein
MNFSVRLMLLGGLAALMIACDKAAPPAPESNTNLETTVRGGKEAPPRPN